MKCSVSADRAAQPLPLARGPQSYFSAPEHPYFPTTQIATLPPPHHPTLVFLYLGPGSYSACQCQLVNLMNGFLRKYNSMLHTKVHYDWGPSGEYASPFVSWYVVVVGAGGRAAFQLGSRRSRPSSTPRRRQILWEHPSCWLGRGQMKILAGTFI